ncbi:MAG: hypothetical protein A3F83_00360 [Candidatus Glassbacteria bacterium RIFCSPLOWO2_12_FULL_58_11]|uniref:Amidohydrolase-related domain-containing protein n=1 Tax=Candidatus Glassbacteria bacterium RIFCSPLOWO2_12_FULL_58_11 TaxID=1817867 RepID=A0A1F5YND8_9BACT|nr:MAG: hypothetical protein A3F83_00360 [Candidatus Glassbacteria bacterium RIFCSPLOWO2_12_FULL_58_11]
MRIIDFHCHFFPDELAGRAIPRMEASSGCRAFTDGTRAGLLRSMDRAGIESALVLPVATNPEKVSSVNRFSASVAEPRLVIAGALHPKSPVWAGDIKEVIALGFKAVKLHPEYQNFRADEPEYLPFFAALRDSGLLLVFHAGQDLSYNPPWGGAPSQLAWLLDQLPGIKIFASHLGGYRMWDEFERCLLGRPVYMDTSFSFGEISDERIRSLIVRHGPDKVFFGTDSPWLDQKTEVENVLRLGLGAELEEKLFNGNAIRLLPELESP